MARLLDDSSSEYFTTSTFSAITDRPATMFGMGYDDDAGTDNDRLMLEIGDSSVTTRFWRLGRDTTTDTVRVAVRWDSVAPRTNVASGTYTGNTWFAGAVEIVSDTERVAYLDGAVGSNTNSSTSDTVTGIDNVTIGREGPAGTDFWSGGLAELAAWDILLDQSVHDALALNFAPIFFTDGLQFYAPCLHPAGYTGDEFDEVGGLTITAFNTPGTMDHPEVTYPGSGMKGFKSAAVAAVVSANDEYYKTLLQGGTL